VPLGTQHFDKSLLVRESRVVATDGDLHEGMRKG
jgi:hypothetical protein